MSGTTAEDFWGNLAWSRRSLLLATPALLGLLLGAAANVGHFGWGFYPAIVLTLLLTPVWFFILAETVTLSSLLLLSRFRGSANREGEAEDLRRWNRHLRFDFWMVGYFATALLLSFIVDR